MSALLEVENLGVRYGAGAMARTAVEGVSFSVDPGEAVGLVGESGSGKSTIGRAVLRLEDYQRGVVRFDGHDLAEWSERELLPFRRQAQMIFQDPYGSLNPRHTVGAALEEVLRVHGLREVAARRERMQDLMDQVGLPRTSLRRYPHEFSGGQRQRVVIARALSLRPRLVVADEPVSALDVSVQAQLLKLLQRIQRDQGVALLFIAHDLAVVRHLCTRVLVLRQGRIVEQGEVERVFAAPAHDYTRQLLAAVPDIESGLAAAALR